jgi:hypothetical protein
MNFFFTSSQADYKTNCQGKKANDSEKETSPFQAERHLLYQGESPSNYLEGVSRHKSRPGMKVMGEEEQDEEGSACARKRPALRARHRPQGQTLSEGSR